MKQSILVAVAVTVGTAVAPPAFPTEAHHEPKASREAGVRKMTEGEVRKVDEDAKKITLKHGPIQNLDMPAMTMVFQVKDAAMLEQVKAGDKVKFQAEKAGGAFTVTAIEKSK